MKSYRGDARGSWCETFGLSCVRKTEPYVEEKKSSIISYGIQYGPLHVVWALLHVIVLSVLVSVASVVNFQVGNALYPTAFKSTINIGEASCLSKNRLFYVYI